MNEKPKFLIKNIEELIPYENNPRNNDAAVPMVAESIKEFGFKVPIIIDKDNVIIAGHTRLKAAKMLGLKEVPCILADDLTDEQAKAFRLADNKVAELSEWNFEKLEIELEGLDDIYIDTFDLDFNDNLGFSDFDEIEEDEIPEAPKETKVKLGEVWRLGNHRLMCGDASHEEDVKKLMGAEKADMVFTDPPYNVAIGSKNKFLNEFQKAERVTEDIKNDKGMPDEEIGSKLWLPAFKNMFFNAKEDCSIYVTMPQGGTHMMMMMMIDKSGWQVKHELIWLKNAQTFSLGRLDYEYKHEPILYGWKNKHNFYGNGEFKNSIWEVEKPRKCDLHPTMKPVKLISNALLNSSQESDVVIDLFGGSGSTLIACEQLNRKCYMMELEPHYCDVIIQRWENFTGEKAELIEE